jgi:CBS domain containing-hemolysin-like protein
MANALSSYKRFTASATLQVEVVDMDGNRVDKVLVTSLTKAPREDEDASEEPDRS